MSILRFLGSVPTTALALPISHYAKRRLDFAAFVSISNQNRPYDKARQFFSRSNIRLWTLRTRKTKGFSVSLESFISKKSG